MTIYELIANPFYKQKHVLELLLCHHTWLAGKDALIRSYDEDLSDELQERIRKDYLRYTEGGEPIEYILGYVSFFGRKFSVTPATIIPRPETEYMIQAVKESVAGEIENEKRRDAIHRVWSNEKWNQELLIDIGTGCGILWISCLLETFPFFTKVFLTDISTDALAIAKKNAVDLITEEQQSKVTFITSDLLSFLFLPPWQGRGTRWKSGGEFELTSSLTIVANLPYIPDETFDTQTDAYVQNNEPRLAFVGGKDGLDLYRKMFAQVKEFLSFIPSCTLFLEMMTWQIAVLRAEWSDFFSFEEVKTFHFQIKIVKVVPKN